jgi:uncharacterized DUF497 family protein
VNISYDPAKNERNIRERQLSFDRAADFEFDTAFVKLVERHGELRWVATGYMDGMLYKLCFLDRPGGIRVISFHRVGRKERREYESKKGSPQ